VASSADRAALTLDDAAAVEREATSAVAVQPEMSRALQVTYESRNTNTTISGVTAELSWRYAVRHRGGHMFTQGDDAARRRYAVLGSQVLSTSASPRPKAAIGQPIRIGNIEFEVVGVLAAKGAGGFGDPNDQVLIPISTAQYRVIGSDRLRQISVISRSEKDITLTMAEIQRILRRQHRLAPGRPDDFSIRNQADFLNTLGETTQVFTLLLAGIAAVSLLVGGIGIMNIMLVSVTERTR
jgi:putative ABC transport system permease protein